MLGQISASILRHYDIQLLALKPLSGGNDAYAQTFQATTETGESLFIKVRPSVEPGVVLSAELQALEVSAVLAPMPTQLGKVAAPVEGHFLLVYPFVEGTNGFEKALELDHWGQVGIELRKVHDSDVSAETLSHLKFEEFEVEGVDEFQSTRERLLTNPQTDSEEAMAQIIQVNTSYIDRVLEGYRDLGQMCRAKKWIFLPCHADLHIGNILVDVSQSVHVVDWDSPRLAPRECDLLFFCDGGIMKRHGKAEEDAFFEGYGDYRPDPTALRYYQFARDLEDFVAYTREATEPSFTPEQHIEAVNGFRALFPG